MMQPRTSALRQILCTLAVALPGTGGVQANHLAVERYIPIDQSPGLSAEGKTYIGRIRDVEEATYTLTVQHEDGGRQKIHVTPTSSVWVDRSKRRRPNGNGTFDDCRKGRRVEILLRAETQEADWVKVEGR